MTYILQGMEKPIKTLVLTYLVFVIIKSILAYFNPSPSIFADEYLYAKMARSLFHHGNFLVHGSPVRNYPLLYPTLLSISYIFKDMTIVYGAMKIINSIVSSLIIFPIYFIAKDFLDHKKALISSILVSVTAPILISPSYILSENLFYPLVTFTIFFLYKSFKTNENKYFIISGILLSATFLTRMIGIALVPICFITYLFRRKEIKPSKVIYHYLTSLILVTPWLIRNMSLFGYNFQGMFGGYKGLSTEAIPSLTQKLISFSSWSILYLGYIILATLVILAIYYLLSYKIKDKNFKTLLVMSTFSIIIFILLAANHSSYAGILLDSPFTFLAQRPIGRYIEPIIPLVILIGIIAYYKIKPEKDSFKTLTILMSLTLAFSALLTTGALFPFNNQSLTYLGTSQYLLEYLLFNKTTTEVTFYLHSFLIMLVLLTILPLIAYKIRNNKKLILIVFLALTINSSLSYSVTYWNSSNNWYDTEPTQLGIWFDDYDKQRSSVLIDEDACTSRILKNNPETLCSGQSTLIGFWMNNDIRIESLEKLEEFDHVITFKQLDLPLIKKTESEIYLYKTE